MVKSPTGRDRHKIGRTDALRYSLRYASDGEHRVERYPDIDDAEIGILKRGAYVWRYWR